MKIAYWILIGIAVVGACAAASKALPNKPLPPDSMQHPKIDRVEITPNTSQKISNLEKITPPVITPKAYRYTRIRYALYFIRTAYGFLILLGILATGFSSRLRNIAGSISRFRIKRQRLRCLRLLSLYYHKHILPRLPNLLKNIEYQNNWMKFITLFWYTLLLSLVIAILNAPFSYYSGFRLEHDFGLSDQKLGSWLLDYAKGFAVDLAVTTIVLWIVYWLINNKRRWDLWLWAAFIPLIAFGIFIQPLVISPLFNKFTPLPEGHLRTEIKKLAAKAGIPNAPIYVSDVSKQTNTTNAYVDGIGHSARIVIWDTTLKKMPDDEILSIVAHEMGHYALKHIFWGFLESISGLLILLPLARQIYESMVEKNKTRCQLEGKGDFAAIPAIMLTMSLLSFAIEPAVNAISRNVEHQADVYGLELNGDRIAMAKSFVDLSDQNLSDPNPPLFIKFWLYSHPTLKERVEFALGEKN